MQQGTLYSHNLYKVIWHISHQPNPLPTDLPTETSENPVSTLLLPTELGWVWQWEPCFPQIVPSDLPQGAVGIPSKCTNWLATGGSVNPVYLQNVRTDRPQGVVGIPSKYTNWPATEGSGNPVYLQNVPTDLPQRAVGTCTNWPATGGSGNPISLQNVPTDLPQGAVGTL